MCSLEIGLGMSIPGRFSKAKGFCFTSEMVEKGGMSRYVSPFLDNSLFLLLWTLDIDLIIRFVLSRFVLSRLYKYRYVFKVSQRNHSTNNAIDDDPN